MINVSQFIIIMNEYIFYTYQGTTYDPQGKEVENCQLMGIVHGTNSTDALQRLLSTNPWIAEHGFDPQTFICNEVVS